MTDVLPTGGSTTRWPGTELVELDSLVPGESPRGGAENSEHVLLLAEVEDLPPILVHRASMQVMDGMHRLRAARLRGASHIEVQFFEGTLDDAFLLAVQRNTTHGLPLTLRERTCAARRIVETHPNLSNRAIAAKVGLSDKTVAALRRRSPADIPHPNVRVGRDGRLRPVVAEEGRRKAAELLRSNPRASLRELAVAAGIAVATARDVRQRVLAGEDPVPAQRRTSAAAERPAPVVALPSEEPDVENDVAALVSIFDRLRNDPSLRLSQSGRVILRLLDAHSLVGGNWTQMAGQVPAHCAPTVAEAAARCAEVWRSFAHHLQQR